jgi:hypothetical protein
LWSKWVRVARWTQYDREWLLQKFGDDFWTVECRGGALNQRFEIEGRDSADDGWDPVSEWRRGELRMADDMAAALVARTGGKGVAIVPGDRGRRRGSGIDTLVRHLRDVEKVKDYREILELLKGSGIVWVVEAIAGWGDNAPERARDAYGRGRDAHREACDYCKSGLPIEIHNALARRKRH